MRIDFNTYNAFKAASVAAVLCGTAPVLASDNATATADAEVLAGFQLANVDPLQFGQIVPDGSGGAVTINAGTGGVTTVGQVKIVGTNHTRARFTVHAPIGAVMVLYGDPSVELTRNGGSETMTASLTHRGGSGLITTTVFGLPIGLLATTATQEIYTGGTLNIAGNQAQGTYEGTFNLMVSYL